MKRPPGPKRAKGPIGTLLYYAGFARDPIGVVRGRFEAHGDPYFVESPDAGLFVLRHPDHLHQVLVTDATSYRKQHTAFDRLSQVLGDGLLTTDGDTWKRQRRMVQPAFARSRLASYAESMALETEASAARFRSGDVIDVGREMMDLTLRIVSRTLFSHDSTSDRDDVAASMRTFQDTIATPDLVPQWLPSPLRRRIQRATDALDRIIYGVIEARRELVSRGETPPVDLLQMLLDAVDEEGDGGRMTVREVRDQLVTLFLAGHETTAHALTWTFYLLAQNPEAERRLHAEVDSVLGDRPARFDDLSSLPWTQQVLEEAMRLYPPVYMIARRAARATSIGEWDVAAGDEVVVWVYLTHHDPRWYPDPEAFRPERFAPDAVESRPRLAYLPFGAGPRACIGQRFAMIEAQIILATLARRFAFAAAASDPVGVRPRITLNPARPIAMRPRAR